jgi:NADH-quinone oxidoreductase subunit B
MANPWTPGVDTNFLVTSLQAIVNWGRKYSMWPYPYGTACCAIEFMAATASDFDISRFGSELVRFSPRQADLLLVLGTITCKQAPILRQIYDQMASPKWVVAVGVCASSGGFYRNYHTMQGIDSIIPVDLYVPGCPPRPEAILQAILELHKIIERDGLSRDQGKTGRMYPVEQTEAFAEIAALVSEREAKKRLAPGQEIGPGQGSPVLGKRSILENTFRSEKGERHE